MRDGRMGIVEDSAVPALRQDRLAEYQEFAELARMRAERRADEAQRHIEAAATAYRYAERAVARLADVGRVQPSGT